MLADELKDRAVNSIREWIERLASGDYRSALEMLHTTRVSWTEASIRRAIAEYSVEFLDASERERTELERRRRVPEVSSRARMPPGESYEFYEVADDQLHIDYDLPIDGEWSDLSAQFEFLLRGDELLMELRCIRVM